MGKKVEKLSNTTLTKLVYLHEVNDQGFVDFTKFLSDVLQCMFVISPAPLSKASFTLPLHYTHVSVSVVCYTVLYVVLLLTWAPTERSTHSSAQTYDT